MTRARLLLIAAALAVTGLAGWALQTAVQTVRQRSTPPTSMAAMLPQGALLTIESPDFAALLRRWNRSPEQRAWLASDNHSVFSNSRLFGRLTDARTEFEGAAAARKDAGSPSFDGDFLTQIAGKQSIFAWYDIGNLEFLYITRLAPTQSARVDLLRRRTGFAQRQAGGVTFYIRRSSSTQGQSRTVAFAEISSPGQNLLILSTREDLIAGALQLIAKPEAAANGAAVTAEPWFADASAALPALDHPPDHLPILHMVLNLDRLVSTPQFRSYWVQRNVTAMSRYRGAVSDLYLDSPSAAGNAFREERALLLKSPDYSGDQADLRSLAAIVPASGAVRVLATHDSALAITALEEKLLGRATLAPVPSTNAPDPALTAAQSGSVSDLEAFIDTPALVTPGFSNTALASAFNAAGLDSVLTWSTALPPSTPSGLWIPIHSAVILRGASVWDAAGLQSALQQSLRGSLTASTLGIEFRSESVALDAGSQTGQQTIYALTGPKPLFFAVLNAPSSAQPNLCMLSDDRTLLLSMLRTARSLTSTEAAPSQLTYFGAFSHLSQRSSYHRLTSLIDATNVAAASDKPDADAHAPDPPDTPTNPPFFSRNIGSLSDTFAALDHESISETRSGAIVRQSLLYQWRRP